MNNKTKIIIGFILLFINLIIIKLFLGGPYLYHFWEELIPELIVFFVISIILMIVPIIIRIINKKRIEYKKGKNICLLNSIVIFIVFSIPNIITILKGNNNEMYSIDPIAFSKALILIYFIIAIIYYIINMFFFVDNKKK